MADGVPFITFNFRVELTLPTGVVCNAAFSECAGIEMTMSPKSIREGGNNGRQIHLAGPVAYGQLTLKRGMSADFGLWRWFETVQVVRSLRAVGEIQMLAPNGSDRDVRFGLTGCLPVKIKAPSLSAKDGAVAIEEMQMVYETLQLIESPSSAAQG